MSTDLSKYADYDQEVMYLKKIATDIDPLFQGAIQLMGDASEIYRDCFCEGAFSMLDLYVRHKVDSNFEILT